MARRRIPAPNHPPMLSPRELRDNQMVSSTLAVRAVYEPVENGWTQARIIEIPGVITAAPTEVEAKELLVDALREYLLALQTRDNVEETSPGARGRVEIVIRAA